MTTTTTAPLAAISPRALSAPESGIVEVVNYARGREWSHSALGRRRRSATPDFISAAAATALQAGENFYTWQRGIPGLRAALVALLRPAFRARALSPNNFYVTGSGMQAIKLAIEAISSVGDELVLLTPRLAEFCRSGRSFRRAPRLRSARLREWRLASRSQPSRSGDHAEDEGSLHQHALQPDRLDGNARRPLNAILDIAPPPGVWIIADEIYALYYYHGARAPSFLDVMQPGDRILFVNSFSKNWAMTGWRVGWVVRPAGNRSGLRNLVQYSTSGVAQFMQQGAIAALDHGDAFVDAGVARARKARDILCDALISTNRVETLKALMGRSTPSSRSTASTDARQAGHRHRRQDRRRPCARHGLRRGRQPLHARLLPA